MLKNSASIEALNLYAKVEDMLGISETAPDLYAHYLLFLSSIEFDSMLDVGCGSGEFLFQMQKIFAIDTLLGIDLSRVMTERAQEKGLPVKNIELSSVDDSYDVVTAVFDMLNYLDKTPLKEFLTSLSRKINLGGYFLCDINTLYGFREVAVGSLIVDDGDRFLTIDSDFDGSLYSSEFTLFEKDLEGHYHKHQESIDQYHHKVKDIESMLPEMKLIADDDVRLYTDEIDKRFLVFQKIMR